MPKNKLQGTVFGLIFWNMFAAAPFSHWLFQRIFSR